MIKKYVLKLWEFFSSITIESVQYAGWTTAVIGALLALTTIIFSQYNDKIVHKANEQSKELRERLISNYATNEIVIMYNNMVISLANQGIYKKTLVLFQSVSFGSAFIWVISGIGYINTQIQLTSSDKFVVFIATLLITVTFIFLPIIIRGFNNNQPLQVSNKNTVNIIDVISYFEEMTLEKTYILKEIFKPKLCFTLDHKNNLKIDYKQSIIASNVIVVLELISKDNVIYILIRNNSNSNLHSIFLLKSKNKKENNFSGIFSLINQSQISKKLYLFTLKDREFLGCFKVSPSAINENEISFLIDDYFHSSVPPDLDEFIKSNSQFIHNGNKNYKLTQKK
jgi:hypothetical protein